MQNHLESTRADIRPHGPIWALPGPRSMRDHFGNSNFSFFLESLFTNPPCTNLPFVSTRSPRATLRSICRSCGTRAGSSDLTAPSMSACEDGPLSGGQAAKAGGRESEQATTTCSTPRQPKQRVCAVFRRSACAPFHLPYIRMHLNFGQV